ncbi:MAG TPA: hypothetical protein DDY52_03675 [Candidatus Moranbacteria bacterium]|nr:hypothetical protein [Candidatus Moranbacteria bacterium]
MYLKNTIQSLFWGIITAGMSLIFQLVIISLAISSRYSAETDKILLGSVLFLAIYSLSEESFKYFIVTKKIINLSYGKTFLLNSWIAGIGFSLVESFIIYQKNISEKIDFSLIDVFSTAPLHILTFGTLGYFLAISEKQGLNIKILLFNFIIHLIYNYSIIYLESYSHLITGLLITILLIINIYGFLIVNKKLASD